MHASYPQINNNYAICDSFFVCHCRRAMTLDLNLEQRCNNKSDPFKKYLMKYLYI